MESVAASNREASEAWSGPLFERFVQYRELVTGGLGAHGEAAIEAYPPRSGDRILDLGCGFGDTTRLAGIAAPEGEAVGVDVAEPFIEAARREAEEAGVASASFIVGDVQVMELEGDFDYALADGDHVLRQPGAGVAHVRECTSSQVDGSSSSTWRRRVTITQYGACRCRSVEE